MADNTYKESNHSGTKRRIPKNLRQIGKINDGLKIYMEDYVKTFVRQLAESEPEGVTAAVLVGEYQKEEQEHNVFIYGAIKLEGIWEGDAFIFTEDTWTSIYSSIKRYFSEGEIAGWYLRKNEWTERNYDIVREVHLDNFAGKDRVLLQHDLMEKDGEFLCYEGGALIPQSGYFIYYDKNEEMQDYMIDHKQISREEEFVEDRAVKEFRTIYQEKHPQEKKDPKKAVIRMAYAAGMVIVLAASAVAVTALNNNDKMRSLEETLETISNTISNSNGNGNSSSNGSEKPSGNIFDDVGQSDAQGTDAQGTGAEDPADMGSSLQEPADGQSGGLQDAGSSGGEQEEEASAGPAAAGSKEEADAEDGTGKDGEEEAREEAEVLQPVFTPEQLTSYIVVQGDTLAGICFRLYGNAQHMKIIQEINQIADANKIFVGQQLIIPK